APDPLEVSRYWLDGHELVWQRVDRLQRAIGADRLGAVIRPQRDHNVAVTGFAGRGQPVDGFKPGFRVGRTLGVGEPWNEGFLIAAAERCWIEIRIVCLAIELRLGKPDGIEFDVDQLAEKIHDEPVWDQSAPRLDFFKNISEGLKVVSFGAR